MRHNYENNPPVGIDLGTSNSAIAYFVKNQRIKGSRLYYLNTTGRTDDPYLMPSSIYLHEDGDTGETILVGKAAENKWLNDPRQYVNAVKRKIGEKDVIFVLGKKTYTPIDLSGEIIKALFQDPIAQNRALCPSGIVVSVPYYFKQHQNDNTLEALNKALDEIFSKSTEADFPKVLGLVPEPVAASLYYITNSEGAANTINDRKVMVFDLGGGTLDITLFKINLDANKLHFEIMSSNGHSNFGGEDFDRLLMDYVIKKEAIENDGLAEKMQRLLEKKIKDAVKEAKEKLSYDMKVPVVVSNLPGGQIIDTEIKRTDFEQILSGKNGIQRNFGKELLECISCSLEKSKIKKEEIDLILLIGSSSQIPYFKNLLKGNFKNARFEEKSDFLKYAVAKGAALYAAYMLDKKHGHEHRALGQGISYEASKIVFRTPHHLGIEKQKGQLSTIIPANTVIPARNSKVFVPTSYTDESQQTVKLDNIKIYQGDHKAIEEGTLLGFVDKLPTIYSHKRKLEEIKIKIDFEATETELSANILIPKSNKNGEDISVQTNITLVNY